MSIRGTACIHTVSDGTTTAVEKKTVRNAGNSINADIPDTIPSLKVQNCTYPFIIARILVNSDFRSVIPIKDVTLGTNVDARHFPSTKDSIVLDARNAIHDSS